MLLLPVGQEGVRTRRWPLINLGVLALCLLSQAEACIVEDQTRPALDTAHESVGRLIDGVQQLCGEDCEDYTALDVADALRDGELGTEAQQAEVATLDAQIAGLLARSPIRRFGYQPASSPPWTLLTSMFVHAGWLHFLGNLLFLYVVGVALEDRWGHLRYAVLYVVGGVVAAGVFGLLHADSPLPLVGASGAIAAVMGAFVVVFGRAPIRFFYWIWIKVGTFTAPAWAVLTLWFIEQLLSAGDEASGNVAYSAHAAGFALGAAIAGGLRVLGREKRVADEVAPGPRTEDPDLVEAELRARRGDRAGARQHLERALARAPVHPAANRLGLRLALDSRDAARATRHALVVLSAGAEPATVLAHHRALAEILGDQLPDARLLPTILGAAHAQRDRDVIQALVRQLYRAAPDSPSLPHALWLLAELYEHDGEHALAHRVRSKLVADHATDPWAQRARQQLAG